MEKQIEEFETQLASPPPPPIRLHPNLAEVYKNKVMALAKSLADPLIRDEAVAILHGLIEKVTLRQSGDGWTVDLQGEIVNLLSLGIRKNGKPTAA